MNHIPTLRQMQYLKAIHVHGTFSKAAEHCFVTQSTLSAGIKEMEVLLGHSLIDRSHKKAVLTNLGRDILESVNIILEEADLILGKAKSLDTPLSGTLKLGIIPTIAPYLLPSILPAIKKEYPRLNLQITEDQSARIVEKLENSALDAILLAFPYDTPSLFQDALFNEDFVIACPAGTWGSNNPASIESLAHTELLLLEEGHCLRDHAMAACHYQAKSTEKTFNATSLATLIQFVQNGYGTTLLPHMAVANGTLPDNIEIIPFKNPAPTRTIGMAWRKKHPQEQDFKLLAQLIRKLHT